MEKLHYIKDEMLAHVPMCTHADPKNILIIGGCENLKGEVLKHKGIDKVVVITDNIADQMAQLEENFFDVAIVAIEGFEVDRLFWGLLNKALNVKGVVSAMASTMLTQENVFEAQLKTLGELFKIVMPYHYEALAHDGHLVCKNLLLASKFYHPTADINLQRADLTEGMAYYNSDIAIGTFQVPTVSKKRFAGLIKF
ncbi:MAG: hypothetical protein IE885_04105 [Campylobacterales bacterium]|nr:hypothetical protein [Campylobacterales bacterium]